MTTLSDIENAVREMWELGGVRAEAALMTPAKQRELSKEFGGHVAVYNGRHPDETDEELRDRIAPQGEPVITRLETEFGGIDIYSSRYCPPDSVYIATRDQILRMKRMTEEKFSEDN